LAQHTQTAERMPASMSALYKAPDHKETMLPPAPALPKPPLSDTSAPTASSSTSPPTSVAQPWDGSSEGSTLTLLFPSFVMPINTLLTLERLEPFETLHRKGAVVKYDPKSMPSVIFVSQ
jgi:hypothetical protein